MNIKYTALGFIAFIFIFHLSKAQEIQIKGTVKDSATQEPVPFAHVAVGQIVTITNMEGKFVLKFEMKPEYRLLQASFMGYKMYSERFDVNKENYEIFLAPSEFVLEAVTVLTGDALMERVYRRIPINYEYEAQRMVSYYKEKLLGNGSLYYLAEGILDLYLPSNVSDDLVKVNPIKTRKKTFRQIEEEGVTMIHGHATDMARSSIWRNGSFLSLKNRGNYEFDYAGKKILGEKDVYIVDFAPKNRRGYISGRIYIEDESYAILKMEYFPEGEESGFWSEIKWEEEYEQLSNGFFYLVRTSYEGLWKRDKKEFFFQSLLVNNETKRVRDEPDMDYYLKKKELFYDAADSNFTESFWDGYNFIKLDGSEVF